MAKKSGTVSMTKSEDDWQTESDLRTLMEAETIEKDPKRLAKVQALAKKKLLDLAAVASEGPND
jgi:predicted PhzF superfamily epimerase YddE/YHI9